MAPTEANMQFCERLVRLLVGGELSARDEAEISHAVRTTMSDSVSRQVRCLSMVAQNLSAVGDDSLMARLRKWLRSQNLGWVFDNPDDELDFSTGSIFGFDYTEFLDDPEVRTPVMAYLLHVTESVIDGRPFIYVMEEFWRPLMDEHFSDFALNKQKTIRKQNGLGVFVTQSPSDVLLHPIGRTMVEQSVTQIFLPNPRADRADYVDGFKLTEAEFEVVRGLAETSRTFLVKQGSSSAICRFDLTGLTDILSIISGTTESVASLDSIRQAVGDDPNAWMPVFLGRHKSRLTNLERIPA
jgi:type IV secretion system protein VirB4